MHARMLIKHQGTAFLMINCRCDPSVHVVMAEVQANVARKNVPKWKSYFMGFACLASDRKGRADNIPRVSLQASSALT